MGKANDLALRITFDPDLDSLKPLKKGMMKIVGDASLTMSKGMAQSLASSYKDAFKVVERELRKVKALEWALEKDNITDAQKLKLQALLKDAKTRAASVEKEFKDRIRKQDKEMERRKKALEKVNAYAGTAKAAADFSEKVGEGVKGVFEDITSKDLPRMLKGPLSKMSSMMSSAGAGLTKKDGGFLGGAGRGLGKLLSTIGPLIGIIAGLGAGIAALIGIFFALDSAAKELNRSLIEAGAQTLDLGVGYEQLGERLDEIRHEFATAVDFNYKWGVTAKETLQTLGAYGAAGLTIHEMVGHLEDATERMEALTDATEKAVAYSKLLGMSSSEVATNFATYMEQLGTSLDGITQRFSDLTAVARDSGFQTKRFMGMILQATSGMSMYNVRLEETAGLLMSLSKILGERAAGEMLQKLGGGLGDASVQDLTVRSMRTGQARVIESGKTEATLGMQEVVKKMGENRKSPELLALLKANKIEGTPEQQAEALAKLNSKDLNALLHEVKQISPGIGNSLEKVYSQAQAFKGGKGGAVASMGQAGPARTLLLELADASRVIGKDLDQIEETDLVNQMASQGITGKQGEEYRRLRSIGREFRAREDLLATAQKEMKKSPERAQQIADEFNKKTGKEIGVYLNNQGKRFKDVDFKTPIKDGFDALILSTGGELAGKGAVSEDLKMAMATADNTRDIASIMENVVTAIMEEMLAWLKSISAFLSGGLGEEEMKKVQSMIDSYSSDITTLGEEKKRSRQKREEWKGELMKEDIDPKRRQELLEYIKRSEERSVAIEDEIELLTEARKQATSYKEGTPHEGESKAGRVADWALTQMGFLGEEIIAMRTESQLNLQTIPKVFEKAMKQLEKYPGTKKLVDERYGQVKGQAKGMANVAKDSLQSWGLLVDKEVSPAMLAFVDQVYEAKAQLKVLTDMGIYTGGALPASAFLPSDADLRDGWSDIVASLGDSIRGTANLAAEWALPEGVSGPEATAYNSKMVEFPRVPFTALPSEKQLAMQMKFKDEGDTNAFMDWWKELSDADKDTLKGKAGDGTENLSEALKKIYEQDQKKREEAAKKKKEEERIAREATMKKDWTALLKSNEDLVKKMQQMADNEKTGRLAAALASAGFSSPLAGAKSLVSGNTDATPELKAFFSKPENVQLLALLSPENLAKFVGNQKPGANDYMVQYGASGEVKFSQRIDPNDTIVASKPGGALDMASRRGGGGKGGTTNVFHLYGNGPSVLAMIEKAQRAGLLA